MNSRLTSLTRARKVATVWSSSLVATVALGAALKADMLGASDGRADCARICAAEPKVASSRAKIRNFQFVYFMPRQSKICTPNPASGHFQATRCTPRAEIQQTVQLCIRLTLGVSSGACQVTKGAHKWSWQKAHSRAPHFSPLLLNRCMHFRVACPKRKDLTL